MKSYILGWQSRYFSNLLPGCCIHFTRGAVYVHALNYISRSQDEVSLEEEKTIDFSTNYVLNSLCYIKCLILYSYILF